MAGYNPPISADELSSYLPKESAHPRDNEIARIVAAMVEESISLARDDPDGYGAAHRIDNLAKRVAALASHPTGRAEALEEAATIADEHAQRAREAAGECEPWSAAQGEWCRAKDTALDISEAIRALAPEQPASGEHDG